MEPADGWLSLPVHRNVMPGVHDLHFVPRCDWRREVGEGHCGEEEDHKEPEVLHECRRLGRNELIRRLKI